MLVIRGTKKLRERVKHPIAAVGGESTTVLGDWFATALFWKPQVALLVNQRTLVPVFVQLAPAATLLDRAPDAIARALRRLDVDDDFIATELAAMSDVRIAPTDDRSVIGVMNEFGMHGGIYMRMGRLTLEELAVEMARMPLGPLRARHGSPDRELAALVGTGSNGRAEPSQASGSSTIVPVYQLKATLKGTKPPIWRRVLVDGGTTLDGVHEVIQAAFGWWNCHIYDFEFGGARYLIPDPDWDFGPPVRDARTTRLASVAVDGASFNYTYDFGDFWELTVTVEKLLPISPVGELPACTDGRRAAPPEDCGGVWGYGQLLAILADSQHPEHAAAAAWASPWGGADLDPAAFDPSTFADNLDALRRAASDD